MKKIILLLCVIIYGQQVSAQQAQSAFYDAKFIYESCFDKDDGLFIHRVSLFDVLKKYYPVASLSEVELKRNPFFGKYVPDLVSQSGGDRSIFSNGLSFSSLGNLDVTTIVDGFAKFIVERTKKELQAAFFDKFIKLIKKPEYKDVQTLFPVTYSVVLRLPEDVYNYEKYIQSLRHAFGKDMETILPHLEDVLKNGRFKDFFNQHLELKSVCLTALYFGKELRQGMHIGEALDKYNVSSPDYRFTEANTDTVKTNAIRFIQEVSRSLKGNSAEEKEYWVPADSIKLMISNPVVFDIYLGLLYQRVKDIRVCNTASVTYGEIMGATNDRITRAKNLIEGFADQVDHAQSTLHELLEKAKKDRTIDDYIAYFSAATRIIESFKENELVRTIIDALPDNSRADVEFYWKKYSNIIEGINSVLNIYTSIKEKNYSVAINNVRSLYEMRYDPDLVQGSVKENVDKIIAFLLDKGAFIASVAEAKTSDEVKEAINMAAMPVGSARVKRMSSFNVAVNAYCGLFGGYEKINKVDNDGVKFNSYGLTAPIGISISKGTKKGWSHSLVITALDLGAVVAFRFSNDTTAQVPTIQLKNILAPGLIYSLGIPKTPLSVNVAAQVGPNLRKVTSTTNDYSNNTYIRYSLAFCVDLPLFNLYTKSR